MPAYYVMSPEYEYLEPVTDDGQGPWYPCREVIEIEAENKSDARVLGLRALRSLPSYQDWRGWNSRNDFNGLQVELIDESDRI